MGTTTLTSKSKRTRRVAIGVAAAALMVGVVVVAGRLSLHGPADDGPAKCIQAMTEAAQRGDVQAYLDCFTGRLREQLAARAAEEAGDARFAASLRAGTADLTGIALHDLQFAGPHRAQLQLERIYRQYNERQQVRLRRVDGRWKIDEMTPPRQFLPEVPYGTPANPPVRSADDAKPNPPPTQSTPP